MSLVRRFVAWVREGYPTGVPTSDYQPLFALLRRQLTEDEAEAVARELALEVPLEAPRVDAGVGAMRVIDDLPGEPDIQRVLERLRAHGALPDEGPDGGLESAPGAGTVLGAGEDPSPSLGPGSALDAASDRAQDDRTGHTPDNGTGPRA